VSSHGLGGRIDQRTLDATSNYMGNVRISHMGNPGPTHCIGAETEELDK